MILSKLNFHQVTTDSFKENKGKDIIFEDLSGIEKK